MLSVSGKNWNETSINKRIIEKIKNDNNFSEILSKILISRKFDQIEINSIKHNIEIFNPFIKNHDFIKGFKILEDSIKKREKIVIIGDYDVDGCVSTSLFVDFFNLIKKKVKYYIPNRFIDGYGASLRLVKKIIKKKPDLIIMLDCGSNNQESVEFLNSKNIKSIIIDHHEIYRPYPKSGCLINPKKECTYNEFDYLCTSSLSYFFINSFIKENNLKILFQKNLIFVLLASICDVMPLRRLNRVIAIKIFNNLDKYNNYIISKILELKKIKRQLEINDLGFIIGPILNSAGRLGDANKIVELITSKNFEIKNKIINQIITLNEKRKAIELDYIRKIKFNEISKINENVLVLHERIINGGIIGIIASRLKDYFDKPSIVLSPTGNEYKASARSTLNFNIGRFIKQAIDRNIIIKGGGHNLAAGFIISKKKINEFKVFINNAFTKNKSVHLNEYISKISPNAINTEFYKNFNKAGPFGPNNNNPVFLIENMKIFKPKIIQNKFVSFYAKSKSGKLFPSISFNFLESEVNKTILFNKNEMSLIVQLKENIWNNKKKLQLIVLDAITNPNKAWLIIVYTIKNSNSVPSSIG